METGEMRPDASGRLQRGFTMIELIVAVGLMIVVLGVLAFVFRQSAGAVGSATEAVTVVQTARNFEARLGRELASAVAYLKETAGGQAQRGFTFDDDAGAEKSARCIRFVSQTMNDGILDTWDVKYHYEEDPASPAANRWGAVKRRKDARNSEGDYELWDDDATTWEAKDEILAQPVRGVEFAAAEGWDAGAVGDENPRLPPYVRVKVTFLDKWGGRTFQLPMDFYFPVYQGE